MSGDLGSGTARAAILLLEKIQAIAPPGPLQLAGGTNKKTIHHIRSNHCLAGIAFGGVARKLIQPFLIEAKKQNKKLIECPEELHQAIARSEQHEQAFKTMQQEHATVLLDMQQEMNVLRRELQNKTKSISTTTSSPTSSIPPNTVVKDLLKKLGNII